MKIRSPNNLSSGHVNINSIRNKFDSLIYVLDKSGGIFLISEMKQDDSFPLAQFKIEGFTTPYRYDRNDKGGNLLLYIRKSISVEINLRKRKWFLNCSYSSHRNSISNHLEWLNSVIDEHSKTYNNFIFIGTSM